MTVKLVSNFRQKTLGEHTNCSKCGLGLGMLCGDCLYMRFVCCLPSLLFSLTPNLCQLSHLSMLNRYGENVIEANQNPKWICPVCRDICNCSFCRQAKGWAPTGNLYRKVGDIHDPTPCCKYTTQKLFTRISLA